MDKLLEYLPFLIPVAVIELALMITALLHVLKHPNYRFGTKPLWIVIVIVLGYIGPIAYFAFGRGEE